MTSSTNWTPYAVPTLADIMDVDLSSSWQQVNAWKATADMIAATRQSLNSARADLASRWPSESSTAAALFFNVIDVLLGYMEESENVSRINGATVARALDSMCTTSQEINQLNEIWHLYLEQLREMPALSPSNVGVPDSWTSDLNSRAHEHMATMDQVIFDATRTLVVPEVLPGSLQEVVQPSIEQLNPVPTKGINNSGGSLARHSVIPRHMPGTYPGPILTGQGPEGGTSGPTRSSGTLPAGDSHTSTSASGPPSDSIGRAPGIPTPTSPQDASVNAPTREAQTRPAQAFGGRGSSQASSEPNVNTGTTQESAPLALGAAGPLAAPSTVPGGPGSGMRQRKSRSTVGDHTWILPSGIRSILVADPEPDFHDPGPGVIGIDW